MDLLNKISYRLLLCLFGFAFVVMLLEPFSTAGFVEPLSVILLTIALFYLLRLLFNKLNQLQKKTLKILIFSVFALFMVIQILWVSLANISLFGDPWHMIAQATRMSQGETTWDIWLETYPNLLPLLSLYLGMIKLSASLHLDFYLIFYAFNILINSIIWALVLRFLWIKKPALSAFTAILILIMPMSYGFLIKVGYSDSLAILSLLLLLMIFDQAYEKGTFTLVNFIATVFIFLVSYLARPNVIIVIVALLILAIYAYLDRAKTRKLWQSCLKMVIACFIGILLASASSPALAKMTGYNLENENVLPTAHWIYMGLNTTNMGEYNPEDRDYSLYHEGYETAKEADIAGIKERIKTQNVKLPFLWLIKFGTLWSDGSFQTSTDYRQFSSAYNWTHGPAFLIQNIGAINILLVTYSKALLSLFILAILVRIWQSKKPEINSFGLMLITIMGVSLFHALLWEVKPRYQFMTFGLILIAAVLSFENLFNFSQGELKEASCLKLKKYLKFFVPIASALSLLLMATVMQLQAQQKVIVTAQQHPVSNYGYSNTYLTLQPGESLYQEFHLPVAADSIEFQSTTKDLLELAIEEKRGEKWEEIDRHSLLASEPLSYQTFETEMSAGDYRFAVHNSSDKSVDIEAMLDTQTLDYPYLIELDAGENASFGFVLSQSASVSKFPLALIFIFLLLFLLTNLLIFRI